MQKAEKDRHKDASLKELANRLKSLSYRDMQRFTKMVHPNGSPELADALLKACDEIEEITSSDSLSIARLAS